MPHNRRSPSIRTAGFRNPSSGTTCLATNVTFHSHVNEVEQRKVKTTSRRVKCKGETESALNLRSTRVLPRIVRRATCCEPAEANDDLDPPHEHWPYLRVARSPRLKVDQAISCHVRALACTRVVPQSLILLSKRVQDQMQFSPQVRRGGGARGGHQETIISCAPSEMVHLCVGFLGLDRPNT